MKTLGDSVLAIFPDGQGAVNAVVEIQRVLSSWLLRLDSELRVPMRVGVASGEA